MNNHYLFCEVPKLQSLFTLIANHGFKLLGPTVRDEVIVFDEIHSTTDLPIGWTDEQEAGHYRLKQRSDQAYFGYNVGQHSWKKYLFPPREKLWSAQKVDDQVTYQPAATKIEKMAFIGVRACDLNAILIQDKVFDNKVTRYQQYAQRRENNFILAVNCTTVANTCFCASMQAGPWVEKGYDIALIEVIDDTHHYFLLTPGTTLGQSICDALSLRAATSEECALATARVEETKNKMLRSVDNKNVHELLMHSWNSPQWEKVAERCINCANCTLVCPTCFCSDTEDKVSLDLEKVERWQSWDSCFNLSHSHVHGGSVRSSAQSRYRQWLTHKFGTWWDQFDTSGCVGCGRCIAWCPVGIDVTEVLRELKDEHNEKNS